MAFITKVYVWRLFRLIWTRYYKLKEALNERDTAFRKLEKDEFYIRSLEKSLAAKNQEVSYLANELSKAKMKNLYLKNNCRALCRKISYYKKKNKI